jgi:hypothetical protein
MIIVAATALPATANHRDREVDPWIRRDTWPLPVPAPFPGDSWSLVRENLGDLPLIPGGLPGTPGSGLPVFLDPAGALLSKLFPTVAGSGGPPGVPSPQDLIPLLPELKSAAMKLGYFGPQGIASILEFLSSHPDGERHAAAALEVGAKRHGDRLPPRLRGHLAHHRRHHRRPPPRHAGAHHPGPRQAHPHHPGPRQAHPHHPGPRQAHHPRDRDRMSGFDGDELGEELGIVPVLVALIPAAIAALSPFLKAAADKIGHRASSGEDAYRALRRHPRGPRLIAASARAARRAHDEGGWRFGPDELQAIDAALRAGASGLPAVEHLAGPKAAPAAAPVLPVALPSIRELLNRGRAIPRQEVEARVADLVALRARLIRLRTLANAGRLTPAGKQSAAKAIALYKGIVALLTPIRTYVSTAIPMAAILFDNAALGDHDLGVAPSVAAGGVAIAAIAITGAALVAIAGTIAAAWSYARSAETQAIQAESTRKEAIHATERLIDAGVSASPSEAADITRAGIDALVTQQTAAEGARSEAAAAGGDGQILGIPAWIWAVGALLAFAA